MAKRQGFSPHRLLAIFSKTLGTCVYCGVGFAHIDSGEWHVDHMIPISQGGDGDILNLVPCCPECNRAKRGRTVEQWRDAMELRVWRNTPLIYTIKVSFAFEDTRMDCYEGVRVSYQKLLESRRV